MNPTNLDQIQRSQMDNGMMGGPAERERAASTAGDQSMITTGPIQNEMYGGQPSRSMQASYWNPNNMNRTDMINHMQQNLLTDK